MRLFWAKSSRLFAILIISLTFFALTGCASYLPQDILAPQSPAAQTTADLFMLLFWISVAIFVLVEGLLVYFVIRYQRRAKDEHPEQYHGNTRLEVTWTVIPALILAVVFALTIQTMGQVGPTVAPAEGLKVEVFGKQWWWGMSYEGGKVVTANEMHIPAGQVANVTLTSDNVIHSFWVPQLMGKTDNMPGHENITWLYTNQTGVFSAQCAEFCGAQHAHMRFRVIVQTPEEFKLWMEQQAAPAVEPAAGSIEAKGKELFLDPKNLCIGCHTIQGTNAQGITGPNLTHFATRGCFAGCEFETTHENIVAWLASPQTRKPGTLMKINPLTDEQITALTAYLESLK